MRGSLVPRAGYSERPPPNMISSQLGTEARRPLRVVFFGVSGSGSASGSSAEVAAGSGSSFSTSERAQTEG